MKGKKNKKIRWVLLSLVVVLLIFSIWTFKSRPVESKTLDVEFAVGATTGVNVDTDKLYFGRIVPGNSAQRIVDIENSYSFPMEVKVFVSKEIAEYIFLDRDIIAEPGKQTKVPITANIPPDTPYGNYSGKIRFDLLKS